MPPDLTALDSEPEQRRHKRVDLFQEIVCEDNRVEARSGVADISVGGMFVDMPHAWFPSGCRITARFALRADEPQIAVDADVHYVQDGIGMGIRFVDLRDEDRDRIAGFVEESTRRKSQGAPLRKSARVFVEVPIRVRGAGVGGTAFDKRSSIVTLSKHGACLVCGCVVDVGTKLLIETARGFEFKSNVVWVGSEATGSAGQVGVQCRGLAQSLGFQFP
jgi:PilZ domain